MSTFTLEEWKCLGQSPTASEQQNGVKDPGLKTPDSVLSAVYYIIPTHMALSFGDVGKWLGSS